MTFHRLLQGKVPAFSWLFLGCMLSCIPVRTHRGADTTLEPMPRPEWPSPTQPSVSPSSAPLGLVPSQRTNPCNFEYLAPFPSPLIWRVAYRGAGNTHHHCPSWSRFGPVRPHGKWHKGLDIAAPTGTPIHSAVDGRLSYRRDPKGWGLYAQVVFHPKSLGGDGRCHDEKAMRFVYAHLIDDNPPIEKPRDVKAGEIVGRVGCSGNATGMCSPSPESHLHLTLQYIQDQWEKVDALSLVAWDLSTPSPASFSPALAPCPIPEGG